MAYCVWHTVWIEPCAICHKPYAILSSGLLRSLAVDAFQQTYDLGHHMADHLFTEFA